MSQINLVIKGDRVTAEKAAHDRGVTFTFDTQMEYEAIGTAPEEDREKIVAWYQEDLTRRAPFPQGSLLFYGRPYVVGLVDDLKDGGHAND